MIFLRFVISAIFFLLELAALAALGYWGFHIDKALWVKILFGIGTPLLAAIIWGTFVSPKASIPVLDPARILLQLVVFVSAAAALYSAGRSTLAAVFLVTALIEIVLVHGLKV